LLDKSDTVFAILVGKPKDVEAWEKVNRDVQEAFDLAREKLKLKPEQKDHRRGAFPAFAAGISYGGGQMHPQVLVHSKNNQQVIDTLCSNPAVRRLAGYGDAMMKTYAPRLHKYYEDMMFRLRENNPRLRPLFDKNVFAATTFNLGLQVVTYEHLDSLNLPAGLCAITAIGEYDYEQGGHVLFWDLMLMVEFPLGALMFIPSAMFRHSNTTIGKLERRYSFTQYSAGSLFRWVECGF
ncbi:hypothetical protein C8Q78DRAFT_942006, partial [Trametes maxima]